MSILLGGAQSPSLSQTQFQLRIENREDVQRTFAIFPGFYNTSGLFLIKDGSGAVTGVRAGNFSGESLTNAGYPVDFAIDDTQGKGFDESVPIMFSMNPRCRIDDIRQFIKTGNVLWVDSLKVISQNVDTFNGLLQFAQIDPRISSAVGLISMDSFLTPENLRGDRIEWNFGNRAFGVSDTTLMLATIPAAVNATTPTAVNFLFTFRSQQDEMRTSIIDQRDTVAALFPNGIQSV